MTQRPYRITVVCLGNICRSPIGEAVLTDRIQRAGLSTLVEVDSAGTGDWNVGNPADSRALSTLQAHGYRLAHRARQLDARWLPEIDLLLAMDVSNYEDLLRMGPQRHGAALRMFRSFDPVLSHLSEPSEELAVPDPYYGSADGFVDVLAMIESASDGLVEQLPVLLGR